MQRFDHCLFGLWRSFELLSEELRLHSTAHGYRIAVIESEIFRF